MARKPLIAGNWKMNGLRDEGVALALAAAEGAETRQAACDMLICPPATLLHPVADAVTERMGDAALLLGAQDGHAEPSGAHTGDLSMAMLADAGCEYVILGHSERRQDHGETDAAVRAKAEAAHAAGLVAVICVGETEDQRDAGLAMATVSGQLDLSIPDAATAANTVVAYEPVWAIGTGRSATPEDAQDMHHHIRIYLTTRFGQDMPESLRILYGGSMKPANAAELLAQTDIDGGLIGGASLKSEDFLAIADAAAG